MRSKVSYTTFPKTYNNNLDNQYYTQSSHSQESSSFNDQSLEQAQDQQHISFGSNCKNKVINNYKLQNSQQFAGTQLFTKLKNEKYKQKHMQTNQNHQRNAKQIFHFLKQRSLQASHSNQVGEHKRQYPKENEKIVLNQNSFQLNPRQRQELQNLKYDKVNYVVRQHFLKGRQLNQIISKDILPILSSMVQQIVYNYKPQECNDLILNKFFRKSQIKKLIKEKQSQKNFENNFGNEEKESYKNLQSTAQYWERSDQKCLQQDKLDYYKISQWKKIQKQKSKSREQTLQSTIKNLRSLNSENKKIDHLIPLKSGNVEISQTLQKDKRNTMEGVNIIQFTLGECSDGSDYENFTQRQCQTNIIQNIMAFNSSGRFAQIQELKQSYPKKNTKTNDPQNLNDRERELNQRENKDIKVLAFNRKKIPKGKAIKDRVMGNINLSQS